MANRGKSVSSQYLVETLWPDPDAVENPEHALRTLIYRLRKELGKGAPGQTPYILFSQGSYSWNVDADYWLDAEELEKLYIQARTLEDSNPDSAIELIRQSLEYYKGDYLAGYPQAEWISPIRNYYKRLFVEQTCTLAGLLKAKGRFADIIGLCEKALLSEPLEECLHLYFLEALLEEGSISRARKHYEYATSLFYREFGVKPSPSLRGIYKRLRLDGEEIELDLGRIREALKERRQITGAFSCDPDTFRHLVNLEERQASRTGQIAFLALFTLSLPDLSLPPKDLLTQAVEKLKETMQRGLRRGDAITQWNEAQFLALLPGLNQEQAEKVIHRIKKSNGGFSETNPLMLSVKLHPLDLNGLSD